MKIKSFLLLLFFSINISLTAMEQRKAPEFPKGLEWLNTDKPFTLAQLKGKIVLLDFWTYCCINCIHIIPDLKKLEDKYGSKLVVIGVHSAKFLTEQSTGNIRQAILRYNIEHPVVNDKDFEIWKLYEANAWPTLVLIDPDGNITFKKSGEGVYKNFDPIISKLVQNYAGNINDTPIALALEKDKKLKGILNFPGKIYAVNTKLYISDSNNNRIIISDLNGNILDIIGSGEKGKKDGAFEDAQFNKPQGITSDSNFLYIADTENHIIRKADLSARTVITIAGTGRQAYSATSEDDALSIHLNSPWDLTIFNDKLYIANAGSHQVWMLDIQNGRLKLHAGSGQEDIIDGPLRKSALAQPSGITANGKKLYIADSEVSAIRSIDINENGEVKTLIGQGLFVFGDEDGSRRQARLQHPLGIVFADHLLYVADTYNNKIKVVDPGKNMSITFAGTGKEGMDNGDLRKSSFNEPGGITYAESKLYVADTNNDLIRIIDMKERVVSTLILKNLEKLNRKKFVFNKDDYKDIIQVDNNNFKSAKILQLNLKLPKGYKLNELAPNQIRIFTADGAYVVEDSITSPVVKTKIDIPENYDKLYAELAVYYCRKDNEGLCLIKNILYEINHSEKRKNGQIRLDYVLQSP